MKIGYLIQSYALGGVDTFLSNLINESSKKNSIKIFYNYSHPDIFSLKRKIERKVDLVNYKIFSIDENYSFRKIKILDYLFKFISIIFLPLIFLYQKKRIYDILKKEKLDYLLVVNGGYPGGDICLAASIVWPKINNKSKAWHSFHNIAVKKSNFFLNNFYKNSIDLSIKKSVAGFVSVSKNCTNSIKQRKNLKNVKAITIYNGLKIPKFKKKNIKQEFNLDKNSKILLMLAEYDLRKGHDFILKVMEEVIQTQKNVYLLICGYGNESKKKHIKKLVQESQANKNVILEKYRNDKFNLIFQSDIVVIPSQSYESFGYTAVEAMSLKKPLVTTNIGGLKEVILNNKNGYVVDYRDHKLFAKKINYLLKKPLLRKSMGFRGYKRYLDLFTSKKMKKAYYQILGI